MSEPKALRLTRHQNSITRFSVGKSNRYGTIVTPRPLELAGPFSCASRMPEALKSNLRPQRSHAKAYQANARYRLHQPPGHVHNWRLYEVGWDRVHVVDWGEGLEARQPDPRWASVVLVVRIDSMDWESRGGQKREPRI